MHSLIKKCFFDDSKYKKTAIISKNTSYTYKDLQDNINRCCVFLSNCNLKYGDKVAIFMSDCPEYIFLFWACMISGIEPTLINKKINLSSLDTILIKTDSKILFTDYNLSNNFKTSSIHIIQFKEEYSTKISQYLTQDLTGLNKNIHPNNFYLCTSGSTGTPKVIPHTLDDINFCAESFQSTSTKIFDMDKIFSVSKIPFAFGFGNTMYLPFYTGATVIICESDNILEIYDLIRATKPTILFAVPTFFNSLLNFFDSLDDTFTNLRLSISCGETLPRNTYTNWFKKTGKKLIEGMGTTELLYIFFINDFKKTKSGSVGKIVPGYSAKVMNKCGNEAKTGEVGELYISGYSSWRKDIEWIDTGDLFYIDGDGNYFFSGRSNDLIKVNGTWVKSETIEDSLLHLSYIKEALVKQENGILSAYIVAEENALISYIDIKKELRKSIPHYAIPEQIFKVSKIPKGVTGKINRLAILDKKGKIN